MDAAGRLARAIAHDGDHAGPAAPGLEVGQVRMEQQVGRAGIAAGRGSADSVSATEPGERLAAVENAGDLEGCGLRCGAAVGRGGAGRSMRASRAASSNSAASVSPVA